MDSKIEAQLKFLYESMSDLRNTIRAIDLKISFILAILILPLTKIDIFYVSLKDYSYGSMAFNLFILLWVLGFIQALIVLIAIDNPHFHINGGIPNNHATFFPLYLFPFTLKDLLFKNEKLSSRSYMEHLDIIEKYDSPDIVKQLTYEQMKLTYIAALKLARSKYVYFFTIIWSIFAGAILIISNINRG